VTTTDLVNLPTSANPDNWSGEQRALMEFAGAATAPSGVQQGFVSLVHQTGLNPFAKQIYVMLIGGKWAIVTGVDGFRLTAQRSAGYEGQVGPQFTADGEKWVDAWLPELQGGKKGDNPAAARIGIMRKGFREPLWQVVTWSEFGKSTGQWGKMPAHMLGIRAETHGLRRTFPAELSGLYTPDDFDAGIAEGVELTKDWAAEVAKLDDKADVAALLSEMRGLHESTPEMEARFIAHAATCPKDSRPPKAQAAPEQQEAAAKDRADEVVYEADGAPAAPAGPTQEPDEGDYPLWADQAPESGSAGLGR
jgi:phage recombination protein Bet